MKIAVNTRLLLKDRLEGIGWYTYETLSRITQSHPEHEFTFLFDREPHPDFLFSKNVKPVVLWPQARHPMLWYIWFECAVARYLNKNRFDVFLSPDGYIPLKTKTPTISVIHDINFHHYPQGIPFLTRKYYQHYFPKFAQRANHIVTVSEYSKNDIANNFKIDSSKITVTHNGANNRFSPLGDNEKEVAKKRFANGNEYFVFVGALNPRKNVARLIQAFDQYKTKTEHKHHLVIVGEAMFMTQDIKDALKKMNHRDSVQFTGRLMVDDLRLAIGGAQALAFVPYFEGFGIPMVEAMYCHTPVIASNKTSMPEVAEDAAWYIDPFDVNSIANALTLVASDKQLREALSAKAEQRKELFSWDSTAQKLYDCIERVANE
jgi:glycosyltransferase involved in cell wall biosynthesis